MAHSTVKGEEKTINLMDVMFGDVWICSGQSNMEFTVVQVCIRSVLGKLVELFDCFHCAAFYVHNRIGIASILRCKLMKLLILFQISPCSQTMPQKLSMNPCIMTR